MSLAAVLVPGNVALPLRLESGTFLETHPVETAGFALRLQVDLNAPGRLAPETLRCKLQRCYVPRALNFYLPPFWANAFFHAGLKGKKFAVTCWLTLDRG